MTARWIPSKIKELKDVDDYVSMAGRFARVKSDESGIEYASPVPGIYLEDYAAFDGVTDDTSAIQGVIDGLATSGGYRRLIAPYGKTALVSGVLNLNKANVIYQDLSVKLANGSSGLTEVLNVTGADTTLIRPIVDGNHANNSTFDCTGIVGAADGFTVKGGTVKNCTWDGIRVDGSDTFVDRFHIEDVYVNDVGAGGIATVFASGKILDNSVVSAGGSGIALRNGTTVGTHDGYRVIVQGNYVTKATPPSVYSPSLGGEVGFLIFFAKGYKYVLIDSNICWDNRNAGVGMDGIGLNLDGTEANLPQKAVITNNIVGYAAGFGIDATKDSIVSNNYIYRPSNHGIVLAADKADPYNNVIISDNMVIEPVGYGFVANSYITPGCVMHDIKITGNHFYDGRTPKQMTHGIVLDATNVTFTNVECYNNTVDAVLTAPFLITGSAFTDLHIKDNLGYNPVGPSSITVGASPYTYTAGYSPETVYIYGGTVSSIVKGGVTIGTSSPSTVNLEPNENVVITYSSAPTMKKDVH